MPFLAALLISAIVSPLAEKVSKKTKIPQKITAAGLIVLLFLAFATLLYYTMVRLIGEIGSLIDRLSADPEAVSHFIDQLAKKLNGFGDRFTFLKKILNSESMKNLGLDLDRLLPETLTSFLSALTSKLPSAAVNVVSKIPSALLFTAVFLISAFYFSTDRKKIARYFSSILPDHWKNKLPLLKGKVAQTLTGYLKAYLLLMLLTFTEVFLGLTILGAEYAFFMSLIIAVVDILPILGTGTVLIPWALISFAMGDARLGTGLLILYGVVLILRQLTEPKIVGNSIGLHPLATLASVYIGLKIMGLSGIFIGPVIAIFIKGLMGAGSVD